MNIQLPPHVVRLINNQSTLSDQSASLTQWLIRQNPKLDPAKAKELATRAVRTAATGAKS
jgi:hypothetical protein